MLPSLTNHATIFLHPAYIAAVKHNGLINKKVIKNEVITLEAIDEASNYSYLIEALTNLLKKPDWKGCKTKFILSGHFTKFRTARWNEGLSKQEQATLISHQLESIYGAENGFYQVFIADAGFKKNNLAYAVSADFYQVLCDLEKQQLITLHSIVPYFVLMTNYWRKTIHENALIAFVDSAHMYFAEINQQSWQVVKAIPILEYSGQYFEKVLSREMMQTQTDTKVSQLFFHEEEPFSIDTNYLKNAWLNIKILKTYSKNDNNKLQFLSYL